MSGTTDPALLRDEALDDTLQLMLLAEAALWSTVDAGLSNEFGRLGRTHWRAAFLIKRSPGLAVRDLALLTGLTKQAASRTVRELVDAGHVEPTRDGGADGRRRPMVLTEAGLAFEARIGERLRAQIARAYLAGGMDGVGAARRILAAMAGSRLGLARGEGEAA